jgi:hypothetical protein
MLPTGSSFNTPEKLNQPSDDGASHFAVIVWNQTRVQGTGNWWTWFESFEYSEYAALKP